MDGGGMSQTTEDEENGHSESENMAAWLTGVNKLVLQPLKLPQLGPHDARIRTKAVGICGSDVHFLKELRIGDYVVKEPMVLGDECAGIVEEVGSEVKHIVPGDRVALEPGISCGCCSYCKEGSYNLCPKMEFFATPPVHGSLANQDLDAEAAEIKKEMGSKIQLSIDCSGFNKTLETALKVTANGGLVCLVGMAQNKMSLHISSAAAREVDFDWCFSLQEHMATLH